MRAPEELEDLAISIVNARVDFLKRMQDALRRTDSFAINVGKAIGEISLDEAEESTIKLFTELVRKK